MFTVHWAERALKELQEIWFDATRRTGERIIAAVETLESHLMSHGDVFGESRAGRWRIAFEAPLAVLFTVNRETRTIRIAHVMRYGK